MSSTIGFFIKKQKNSVRSLLYKIVPFKYRYGKKYVDFLKIIEKSKTWSHDESINYQIEKTKNILRLANDNIPYYKKLFKSNGFDYNIKSFDDIKNLPILTKDDIITNYDLLINPFYKKKHYKMNSSGTTGKRLEILGTDDLFKIEAAFITNAMGDHGINLYRDHSIWIRRYSPSESDPIFFRDTELNRTYMSAFDLNDNTIRNYVDYINSTRSKTIVSYPSTLYYLSLLCEKHNLKLKHIINMHGASEVCLPQWREKIKEIMNINIKMHYGQVEKVCFAHQDKFDDLYKENLLYSYNEFDQDQTVIGTGFYNELMPLIRYKTNDKIILNNKITDFGAFPKTILDIEGRNGDMLITETDSYVPSVNFYSFMSKIEEVDMFQIIQKKQDKSVQFNIVINNNYSNNTKDILIEQMKNRLGNVSISINIVDTLERDNRSNKLKTISLI